MEASEYFYMNITGQIEAANFPVGFDGSKLFCRYDVVVGQDWELISGISTGITQCASPGRRLEKIVFNMPIELMYKSTNPFGWPQIVFSLYGPNWWGTESSKGYARIHVPPGGDRKTIRAPILVAKCSNVWSAISSWFTDRNPELRDPKILLDGNKSKALFMESYGELVVTLQSIAKGGDALCLEWN